MNTPSLTPATADVPDQVFSSFLEAVRQAGLADAKVDALRKTLLETRDLSEAALKRALETEESVP